MSEIVCVRLASAAGMRTVAEDLHLRACLSRPEDGRSWPSADVLHFARPVDAQALCAGLDEYPGCVVCVAPMLDGRVALAVRAQQGSSIRQLRTRGIVHSHSTCAIIASAVHALLTWGLAPDVICTLTVEEDNLICVGVQLPRET